jgi:hypothetical protein
VESHMRSLAWPGLGAGARHARVNGPPKFAPPCGGVASFCRLIFWSLGYYAYTNRSL